ncbi:signal peptide peptidase SppA, 36K type [Desulfovibrio sp. X2]|uniref:signal peptide peptidase SppA n=1 Tax=Desulfovibrio sp. X2 TaxID=941449 RepID=UPI000358A1F8|nr:signal peptide peptidase SppA [Desulfovibrio sp. X2]EPR44554.1 signal peptide peptidase SppA, 36K type [Desulfovibrio sp. X2]
MTESKSNKPSFSQRHPFLFGFTMILAAVVLLTGAMAAFRHYIGGKALLPPAQRFAMVRIDGLISDSEKITEFIDTIKRDDTIKGVIIRIDSPGGVVAPSQEIFHAVQKLAKVKPVIASMAAVAASGGYYVACGAPTIVANPGTLTGSIGVLFETGNVVGLMEKLGIKHELIVSGKYKGAGSPFEPLTDEQRDYLQALVLNIHQQFVNDVAEARKLPREKVEALAQGQAFTGQQALANGLVDSLGGLDDAVDLLKARTGLTGQQVPMLEGPQKERAGFLRELLSELVTDVSGKLLLQ